MLEIEIVSEEMPLYAHSIPLLFLDVLFGRCWRQDKKQVWVESVYFSVAVMVGDARGALETRGWQVLFL